MENGRIDMGTLSKQFSSSIFYCEKKTWANIKYKENIKHDFVECEKNTLKIESNKQFIVMCRRGKREENERHLVIKIEVEKFY